MDRRSLAVRPSDASVIFMLWWLRSPSPPFPPFCLGCWSPAQLLVKPRLLACVWTSVWTSVPFSVRLRVVSCLSSSPDREPRAGRVLSSPLHCECWQMVVDPRISQVSLEGGRDLAKVSH